MCPGARFPLTGWRGRLRSSGVVGRRGASVVADAGRPGSGTRGGAEPLPLFAASARGALPEPVLPAAGPAVAGLGVVGGPRDAGAVVEREPLRVLARLTLRRRHMRGAPADWPGGCLSLSYSSSRRFINLFPAEGDGAGPVLYCVRRSTSTAGRSAKRGWRGAVEGRLLRSAKPSWHRRPRSRWRSLGHAGVRDDVSWVPQWRPKSGT